MSAFNCNLCGGKVDLNNGGVAMMLTFCNKKSTSLINVSFCGECYQNKLDEKMRSLNDVARLGIAFGENGNEV